MAAIRMSNSVIRVLTLVTLLLSAPVLAAGFWLRSRAADGTQCDHLLSTPAIALGAALMAVSLAGLAGACCHATWLLRLSLLAMLALILALLCFTAFAFAVTTTKQHGAAGYSATWLRRHVEARRTWARTRACLAGAHVCKRLEDDTGPLGGLSPVESGCCRPPASCNFTYAGGTEWTKQAASRGVATAAGDDPDCRAWGNGAGDLCYGCQSCKAGVVAALRRDWKRAAVVSVVFLAVIFVVYSVACCAFGNSRRDNYAYHSARGWKQPGGDAA